MDNLNLDSSLLSVLNGLAGFAALVNSLLMWPTIKYLKSLEPRIERLEAANARRTRPRRKRK